MIEAEIDYSVFPWGVRYEERPLIDWIEEINDRFGAVSIVTVNQVETIKDLGPLSTGKIYDKVLPGDKKTYFVQTIVSDAYNNYDDAETDLRDQVLAYVDRKTSREKKEDMRLFWRQLPEIENKEDFRTSKRFWQGYARLVVANPEMPDKTG